jgi:ATP-binding cassette subfamily B (MDR/TAP) protein 1
MIVRYTVKEVQAFSSASAIAQEVLQNIRTVTAFHGQKKEEERYIIMYSLSYASHWFRFANNLIEAKSMGIKKGIYVGTCQALSNILNYAAFAIVVWYYILLILSLIIKTTIVGMAHILFAPIVQTIQPDQ